jgi:flagellin-like protein
MKRTNRKNKGVSTIIAAALLVAMTVIVAVALGSTVLSAPTVQKLPQIQISGWASEGANEIRLTHLGGDPINTAAVTFKTYIPGGAYADVDHIIPNSVNLDAVTNDMWMLSPDEPTEIDLPMVLETDSYKYQGQHPDYPDYAIYSWGYLEPFGTGVYNAPVQAGDTLVLDFDKSFATGTYGLYAPEVGEQFVVEVYQDGTPFTAVTITVQP